MWRDLADVLHAGRSAALRAALLELHGAQLLAQEASLEKERRRLRSLKDILANDVSVRLAGFPADNGIVHEEVLVVMSRFDKSYEESCVALRLAHGSGLFSWIKTYFEDQQFLKHREHYKACQSVLDACAEDCRTGAFRSTMSPAEIALRLVDGWGDNAPQAYSHAKDWCT